MVSTTEIKPNLHKLVFGNKEIYLLGTAHVSHASVILVKESLNEIRPDTVAVELCEPRFKSLTEPDRWKNTDLVKIIKEGKTYLLLAQMMLANFQKKLGKKLDVRPGAEMIEAIDQSKELGAQLVLVDREVAITLRRVWSAIGFFGVMKLIYSIGISIFDKREVTKEGIERLKSSDALAELLAEFSNKFPKVKEALISERDQFLACKIREAPSRNPEPHRHLFAGVLLLIRRGCRRAHCRSGP